MAQEFVGVKRALAEMVAAWAATAEAWEANTAEEWEANTVVGTVCGILETVVQAAT